MKDYGMVRSTVRPEPVKVDEFSVWKHSDIQEITENIGEENEFVGWEYNMVQYDKNEFIKMQISESKQLSEQITDCLLYTSPSPRDGATSRMPSSA